MWTGSGQAAAHWVSWLHAETVALVESRDFHRPLAAVVRALVTDGTLSGEEVHRLVDEHTYPWTPRRESGTAPPEPHAKLRAVRSFDDFPNVPVLEGELFAHDAEVVQRVPEAFEPV